MSKWFAAELTAPPRVKRAERGQVLAPLRHGTLRLVPLFRPGSGPPKRLRPLSGTGFTVTITPITPEIAQRDA